MRVLVAGATGVVGRPLVAQLLGQGHEVLALSRSAPPAVPEPAARYISCDVLDSRRLESVVKDARPDAVIHQLTSIPDRVRPRRMRKDFADNNRVRVEGTRNLVAAARGAGVERLVAQSIAFAYAPTADGQPHREADPLFVNGPAQFRPVVHAVVALEEAVLGAGGTVLRYGYLYGPGTWFAADGYLARDLRRRRLPLVGQSGGVWSFVHPADAARAAVLALERGRAHPYNIVDNDPAPVAEWLPALAGAIGAPTPLRVPEWVARLAVGDLGVDMLTRAQGASNDRARTELDWTPTESWRIALPRSVC